MTIYRLNPLYFVVAMSFEELEVGDVERKFELVFHDDLMERGRIRLGFEWLHLNYK